MHTRRRAKCVHRKAAQSGRRCRPHKKGQRDRSCSPSDWRHAIKDPVGRALAVLEAKSTSVNLSAGEAQGKRYADQLGVSFIFLSNGEEVWFRTRRRMPISDRWRRCLLRA